MLRARIRSDAVNVFYSFLVPDKIREASRDTGTDWDGFHIFSNLFPGLTVIMKLLTALVRKCNPRHFATTSTAADVSCFYAKLTHRSLLRIRGQQTLQFLQGIVTNDTRLLSKTNENRPPALYALMLNTQGRLLYDLILYAKDEKTEKDEEEVYIECDRSVLPEVTKQLIYYRLRKKLDLQPCESLTLYALFSKPPVQKPSAPMGSGKPFLMCRDPRVSQLGFRAIVDAGDDVSKIFQAKEADEEVYHALRWARLWSEIFVSPLLDYPSRFRYSLGVGEGCGDMPPGGAFPLEANGDYMNAISFHKGCYVGQELTARTHHTGVVRKRLMPLKFDTDASKIRINAKIQDDKGIMLGKFRRGVGEYGLGLLYVGQALAAKNIYVQQDSGAPLKCQTEKPEWWGTDPMVEEAQAAHGAKISDG